MHVLRLGAKLDAVMRGCQVEIEMRDAKGIKQRGISSIMTKVICNSSESLSLWAPGPLIANLPSQSRDLLFRNGSVLCPSSDSLYQTPENASLATDHPEEDMQGMDGSKG